MPSITIQDAAGERHPVGVRHPPSTDRIRPAHWLRVADYQPDAAIEGPADADPLLRWVLLDGMTPPLALLGYAPDHPQTAAFWPYAVFSQVAGHDLRASARHRRELLRPSRIHNACPLAAPPYQMMILKNRTMRRRITFRAPGRSVGSAGCAGRSGRLRRS